MHNNRKVATLLNYFHFLEAVYQLLMFYLMMKLILTNDTETRHIQWEAENAIRV